MCRLCCLVQGPMDRSMAAVGPPFDLHFLFSELRVASVPSRLVLHLVPVRSKLCQAVDRGGVCLSIKKTSNTY